MHRNRYPSRGGGLTPRERQQPRPRGQGSTHPLRGLFASSIWHCDCSPRLPAEHFKVKKEGRNQGRWFYTCQNRNKGAPAGGDGGGCGFFLWDEDARLREEGAVLGTGGKGQEGWDAGRGAGGGGQVGKGLFSSMGQKREVVVREDSETDSPSPSPAAAPIANSRKKRNARDASLDLDDNDEDEFGLQPEEEQELAKLDTSSFETPQKAQKAGVYATPATTVRKSSRKLPWAAEEPVSPTSTRKTVIDYFNTPSKTPTTAVTFDEPASSSDGIPQTPADSTTIPPPTSPTPPTRHKNALHNPSDSNATLTTEVLSLLSTLPTPIPQEKIDQLRSIVSKHDLKTQGVIKGREISRLALKAKGAKIVELEARIASLEAERERDRGVIGLLRGRGRRSGDEEDEEEEGESLL